MIFQKFIVGISAGLLVCSASSLCSKPVQAGSAPVPGTTGESSSIVGDTFAPDIFPTGIPSDLAGARLAAFNASATNSLQAILDNGFVSSPVGDGSTTDVPNAVITSALAVLGNTTVAGTSPTVGAANLAQALSNAGVNSNLASQLIESLQGVLQLTVVPSAAGNLAIQVQGVNLAQLNQSINIFRSIVLNSNQATLQNLQSNPDFLSIRQMLSDLQTAFTEANQVARTDNDDEATE